MNLAGVYQLEEQIWSFSESTTIMNNTKNNIKWVRNPNKVQTFPSFGIQDTLIYYAHFNGNDLFIYGILFKNIFYPITTPHMKI